MKIFDPKAIEILSDKYGRTEPMTDELIKKNEHILLAMDQYASAKAEEEAKAFAVFVMQPYTTDPLKPEDFEDRYNQYNNK